jgi:hypothetical protein
MYNSDTDLLFPPRVIPTLKNLRGPAWQQIVERVSSANDTSLERLAFVLTLARLGNCATCDTDTYRALHGCTQCAKQAVTRFRGSDDELIELFTSARKEIETLREQKKL